MAHFQTEVRRVQINGGGAGVTDRALRYRANAIEMPGPRICYACAASRSIDRDHVDGHEENTNPANLLYLCRSCNTKKGLHFRNAGRGRLTNQFNPGRAAGAASLGQWITALLVLKGESDAMTLPAAIAMVHATSAAERSNFASQIWQRRRARSGEVPF